MHYPYEKNLIHFTQRQCAEFQNRNSFSKRSIPKAPLLYYVFLSKQLSNYQLSFSLKKKRNFAQSVRFLDVDFAISPKLYMKKKVFSSIRSDNRTKDFPKLRHAIQLRSLSKIESNNWAALNREDGQDFAKLERDLKHFPVNDYELWNLTRKYISNLFNFLKCENSAVHTFQPFF